MSKKDNGRPPKRERSAKERYKIRQWYKDKAAEEKAGQGAAQSLGANNRGQQAAPRPTAVGKVYRGETKYIDREPKKQRDYVVVRDTPRGVTVAKLKSIKQLDENGKNADRALVEINHERYGMPNRTGVDFQRFDKNLMSGKPLDLKDKDVFPEDKERFTLGSHDTARAVRHTKSKKKK